MPEIALNPPLSTHTGRRESLGVLTTEMGDGAQELAKKPTLVSWGAQASPPPARLGARASRPHAALRPFTGTQASPPHAALGARASRPHAALRPFTGTQASPPHAALGARASRPHAALRPFTGTQASPPHAAPPHHECASVSPAQPLGARASRPHAALRPFTGARASRPRPPREDVTPRSMANSADREQAPLYGAYSYTLIASSCSYR